MTFLSYLGLTLGGLVLLVALFLIIAQAFTRLLSVIFKRP